LITLIYKNVSVLKIFGVPAGYIISIHNPQIIASVFCFSALIVSFFLIRSKKHVVNAIFSAVAILCSFFIIFFGFL